MEMEASGHLDTVPQTYNHLPGLSCRETLFTRQDARSTQLPWRACLQENDELDECFQSPGEVTSTQSVGELEISSTHQLPIQQAL